jgi:hypothetical protein
VPGAAQVLTDRPLPDLRHGVGHLLHVLRRHEGGDLVEHLARCRQQRRRVYQTEDVGQRVVDPTERNVRVGVRGEQRAVVPDELADDPTGGARRGHAVHRLQQQRMVDDEQVGAPGHCVVDDGRHRVDGERDLVDRLVELTHDQPDGVPRLGEGRWVLLIEHSEDVADDGSR